MAEKKVLVHINRAPFGNVFYTEGLRAALGASASVDEHQVTVLFQGDGVFYTLKNVDRSDAAAYFAVLTDQGTRYYVVDEDLRERSIGDDELAGDMTVIGRERAFQLFQENDINLDF
jgi:sulfur relay (sulfurtransferase) DsrF/TusC family protein